MGNELTSITIIIQAEHYLTCGCGGLITFNRECKLLISISVK